MATYKNLTDLQLIDLLKKDDESAFEEIYIRYAETLTDFTSSKLFNFDDAKDIIHDLFVRLWSERKNIQVDSHLKAYLFKITRHRIVDTIRKNITREEYAAMLQRLENYTDTPVEQKIAAEELKERIQYSLKELSPRVREVYMMSREDNLTIPEIAERLGVSEQTVKNQLSSALKHLRQSLAAASSIALVFWSLQ
ncbi:RNA polymerase sigma-70 factor (ECF subfamily) [Mucilaginibacter oryzae]|uniref:RNA polymerase sigma-70 factor (ECF subfamily) n=1 Tax=Mucilaginibacter oryzae TaxID=468058 RepID=A0A316GYB9_9SPHI|nr:RNA polymerase sigma-70 factor [Mucilaginibacter oryzae]PWK70840.1 RNA polymerase sigma-70 factor (ECF subfamily) [Mucilaginibacter oryzae]